MHQDNSLSKSLPARPKVKDGLLLARVAGIDALIVHRPGQGYALQQPSGTAVGQVSYSKAQAFISKHANSARSVVLTAARNLLKRKEQRRAAGLPQ